MQLKKSAKGRNELKWLITFMWKTIQEEICLSISDLETLTHFKMKCKKFQEVGACVCEGAGRGSWGLEERNDNKSPYCGEEIKLRDPRS